MNLEMAGVFPSSLSGGLHPLLIPEVVENVFNFCSFKDLTSCRLVSKVWHDNSLKRWRSLAKVTIIEGDRRRSMMGFRNFVKDEKRKPGLFKPYAGHFSIGMLKNLDPFLKEFRFQISVLELKNVTFNDVGDLRKVIFQSCTNMKELTLLNPVQVSNSPQDLQEPAVWMEPQFGTNLNLKRLTLPRRTESFGITRMEIVSHFPALEELIQKERSIRGESWDDADDDKLFSTLLLIRDHPSNNLKLKRIEDFEITQPEAREPFCLPFSLYVFLASHAFLIQLEHLAVVIGGSVDDAEFTLFDQVFTHRETLRKLDLLRPRDAGYLCPKEVFITEVDNLEELTLRSRMFSSLDFLKRLPNLKKLTIYGWDDGYLDNIVKETRWIKNLVGEKCTELNLAFHMDKQDLQRVVRIFPNVEKVTISLDNKMFEVVCRSWKKLVELNVYDSKLDDLGITGLNEEEIASANDERSLISRGKARKRRPNISWLPSLRRVSISNWEPARITRSLGHASATFGFQQVPNLDYLHIINYNVEEDVKEALRVSATSCVFSWVQRDKKSWLTELRKNLF